MPFSKAATSSVRVSMVPLASSMAFSKSEAAKSSCFLLSSFLSISASQYAFFWSSLDCSLPSKATMSSIMASTLSKPTVLPRRASARKSKRGSWSPPPSCVLALRACNARCLTSLPLALVCNSEGLGNVFLKSSKASSSFRILIVSARANNSSVRVFCTASHSSFFFAQLLSRSAKNFLSSPRDLVVSSKSSFKVSILTPVCPWRPSFASIACVLLLTSFCLAATKEA
mmetsp:Transcript_72895/g.193624  ORF Transcript_72895/g.193624 Transcript_72895/m.193624 type:complete len:228 (-) Transcript_72895:765-1448(-)